MDNIIRVDDESDKIYQFRCKFINENIKNEEFKLLVKESKILANIKFKKCRYDSKIYNKLKKFLN